MSKEQDYIDYILVTRGVVTDPKISEHLKSSNFVFNSQEFAHLLQESSEVTSVFYNRSVTVHLYTDGIAGHVSADLPCKIDDGIQIVPDLGLIPEAGSILSGLNPTTARFASIPRSHTPSERLSARIPITEEQYKDLAEITAKRVINPEASYQATSTGWDNYNCIDYMNKHLQDAGIRTGLNNLFPLDRLGQLNWRPILVANALDYSDEFKLKQFELSISDNDISFEEETRIIDKKRSELAEQHELAKHKQLLEAIARFQEAAELKFHATKTDSMPLIQSPRRRILPAPPRTKPLSQRNPHMRSSALLTGRRTQVPEEVQQSTKNQYALNNLMRIAQEFACVYTNKNPKGFEDVPEVMKPYHELQLLKGSDAPLDIQLAKAREFENAQAREVLKREQFDAVVADFRSGARIAGALGSIFENQAAMQASAIAEAIITTVVQFGAFQGLGLLAAAPTPLGAAEAIAIAVAAAVSAFRKPKDTNVENRRLFAELKELIQIVLIELRAGLQQAELNRSLDRLDNKVEFYAVIGKLEILQDSVTAISQGITLASRETQRALEKIKAELVTLNEKADRQLAQPFIAGINSAVTMATGEGIGGQFEPQEVKRVLVALKEALDKTMKVPEVAGKGTSQFDEAVAKWSCLRDSAEGSPFLINSVRAKLTELTGISYNTPLGNPTLYAYLSLALLLFNRKLYSSDADDRQHITKGIELPNIVAALEEGKHIQQLLLQVRDAKIFETLFLQCENATAKLRQALLVHRANFEREQTDARQRSCNQRFISTRDTDAEAFKAISWQPNALAHPNWYLGTSTGTSRTTRSYRNHGSYDTVSQRYGAEHAPATQKADAMIHAHEVAACQRVVDAKIAAVATLPRAIAPVLPVVVFDTALKLAAASPVCAAVLPAKIPQAALTGSQFIFPTAPGAGPILPLPAFLPSMPVEIQERIEAGTGDIQHFYHISGATFHWKICFENNYFGTVLFDIALPFIPGCYQGHEAIWNYWLSGILPIDGDIASVDLDSSNQCGHYTWKIHLPVPKKHVGMRDEITPQMLEKLINPVDPKKLLLILQASQEQINDLRIAYNVVLRKSLADPDEILAQALTEFQAAFNWLKAFMGLAFHDDYSNEQSEIYALLHYLPSVMSADEIIERLKKPKNKAENGLNCLEETQLFIKRCRDRFPVFLEINREQTNYVLVDQIITWTQEFIEEYEPTATKTNITFPLEEGENPYDRVRQQDEVSAQQLAVFKLLEGAAHRISSTALQELMTALQDEAMDHPELYQIATNRHVAALPAAFSFSAALKQSDSPVFGQKARQAASAAKKEDEMARRRTI